jgi:hypothetical protein
MLVLAELSLVSTSTTWVKSIWQVRHTQRGQCKWHFTSSSTLSWIENSNEC